MILSAILLLLVTPFGMLVLRLVQRVTAPRLRASPGGRGITLRSGIATYLEKEYRWLLALMGTLAAWLLVLMSRPQQAYTLSLVTWRPLTYFPESPKILVDPVSWSFALALATLVLAVILTVPIRQQEVEWRALASSLALAGFGLLAVLAGNPLTLLLAWAAIDVLEIGVLLVQVRESKAHVQALVTFSARVGGLGLLLWADVTAASGGNTLVFTSDSTAAGMPAHLSLFLLIAAGLRLGVLPFHLPYRQEPRLRRGLGTSLRLVPATASLMLLTRTSIAGIPAAWTPYLLVLTGLSALYGAILWVSAPDEMSGRPYWILGMAAFSVAAGICRLPVASLAWGMACVFSGGLLFLFSTRHRFLLPLPLFGLLGFLGLPLTPAWAGLQLYASRSLIYFLPVFVLAHVLLIFGYIQHATRVYHMRNRTVGSSRFETPSEPVIFRGSDKFTETVKSTQAVRAILAGQETGIGTVISTGQNIRTVQNPVTAGWIWVIYPLGLALFPVVQFVWLWQATRLSGDLHSLIPLPENPPQPLLSWLGGAFALGLAVLFLWIKYQRRPMNNRLSRLAVRFLTVGQKLFSLGWFYNTLGITLRLSVRFVRLVTGILEGEGGILWVLALLALLVALLLRGGQL